MSETITSIDDAESDLLSCAALLAEKVASADGHAQAMRRMVGEFLERKKVDLAAQFADTVSDSLVRDRLLCDIAAKCAELNDDEYAFQLAEAIDDANFRSVAHERIAITKAASGELEKAREIAETLEHPAEALGEIAAQESKRGEIDKALQTISRIDFPPASVAALQSVGLQYFEKGELDKAVDFLSQAVDACKEIEFPEEKIRALHSLAASLIHINQNENAIGALELAREEAERLDNVHRDNLLALISADFLRAGSVELADRTLDLISDKVQIAITLLAFAQHFALNKEIAEALEALDESYEVLRSQTEREVRDSRERFNVLATIAVRYAAYGKIERAVQIAGENPFDVSRLQALIEIAKVCAQAGNEEALESVIDEIPTPLEKVMAIVGAAFIKLENGAQEIALRHFEVAVSLTEGIDQISARCELLGEIALGFSLAGAQARAREIAHEALHDVSLIRDDAERVNALANLSSVFSRSGIEVDDEHRAELKKMVLAAVF